MFTEIASTFSAHRPQSAGERAFRKLWRMISHGEMKVGEVTTEETLALSLSISRTPLRDAVKRLEALGLIERESGKGLKVTSPSMSEMLSLSTTREMLEGLLAAAVAERVSASQIDLSSLLAINDRYVKVVELGDPDLAMIVGHEFHAELRTLSQNHFASLCHVEVLLAFERYRYLAREALARPSAIVDEHKAILHAIQSGNPALAEREMRQHLVAARKVYAEILAEKMSPPVTGSEE